MFDAKKLQQKFKKNNNIGLKAAVLAAAGATIVASGDAVDTNSNTAPVMVDGVLKLSAAENSDVSAILPATDANGDVLTYALSGEDADKFSIEVTSGKVSLLVKPNFEAPADTGGDNVYKVTVTATDVGGLSDSRDVEINITNVNDAPVFAGFNIGDVAQTNAVENQTAAAALNATDEDGDAISYTLSGADAGLFTNINGAIFFINAPDFENPKDVDKDNVYEVIITATDTNGATISHLVKITVSDVGDAVIDASSLTDSLGARFIGALGDYLGASVSYAGDVNGDGIDDFIMGAYRADNVIGKSGSAYVIFGKIGGLDANLDHLTLDGTDGFRLDGTSGFSSAGTSVSGIGDINADGFDDLIVGASSADEGANDAGSAYIIYGKADFSANSGVIALNALGANGFILTGESANDDAGKSVSGLGDINGDGFDDFAIGAYRADPNLLSRAGSTYIIYGKAGGFAASASLSTISSAAGFRVDGVSASDYSSFDVSTAGDFNNDGFDDFIIGAYGADSFKGASYLIYGKSGKFSDNFKFDGLTASQGFKFGGIDGGDALGESVAQAGDINGDGFDDIIVSASDAEDTGNQNGEAYIIFGTAATIGAGFDATDLNGTNGFRLRGSSDLDALGMDVAGIGDFNGDGIDDLAVTASGTDFNGNESGSVYIIFGKTTAFAADMTLDGLNGIDGFRIDGESAEFSFGMKISGAGDVNGDGFDDFIVGAFNENNGGGSSSGVAYVIFGNSGMAIPRFEAPGAPTKMSS